MVLRAAVQSLYGPASCQPTKTRQAQVLHLQQAPECLRRQPVARRKACPPELMVHVGGSGGALLRNRFRGKPQGRLSPGSDQRFRSATTIHQRRRVSTLPPSVYAISSQRRFPVAECAMMGDEGADHLQRLDLQPQSLRGHLVCQELTTQAGTSAPLRPASRSATATKLRTPPETDYDGWSTKNAETPAF